MQVTPSMRGSFLAGIGLWVLVWAMLFKGDEIAKAGGFERWVSSDRCLRWINKHKSTFPYWDRALQLRTHGVRSAGGDLRPGRDTDQHFVHLRFASSAGQSKAR